MKQKILFVVLVVEGILFLGLSTRYNLQFAGALSCSSIPFVQLGKGLRMLSLHSSIGNVLAIFCYVIVCALPLVYLGYRLLRRKARGEDALLVVMTMVLAYITYYFINPSLIITKPLQSDTLEMQKVIMALMFYTNLISYLLIRYIRHTKTINQTLKSCKILFTVISIILVYFAFGESASKCMEGIKKFQIANTEREMEFYLTTIFLVISYLITVIPMVLNIAIIIYTLTLLNEIQKDRFGEKVAQVANRLHRVCVVVCMIELLLPLAFNIAQMLLRNRLLQTNYSMWIPLGTVMLTFVVMLFSNCFSKTKELKKENDMFI